MLGLDICERNTDIYIVELLREHSLSFFADLSWCVMKGDVELWTKLRRN